MKKARKIEMLGKTSNQAWQIKEEIQKIIAAL